MDDCKVPLQDIRLEQKYGIIRGCRRKSTMAVSHRGDTSVHKRLDTLLLHARSLMVHHIRR